MTVNLLENFMQHEILTRIKAELSAQSDPVAIERGQTFSKEPLKLYGLSMPAVGKIAKAYFKEINMQTKREIFDLCEDLWQSGYLEEAVIACEWSYELRKQYEPEDGEIFARWIETYVDNWITCDTLCNHTVGTFVEIYPAFIEQLKQFAYSGNRWMRRAAAVTLIIPARRGLFLDDIFEIADILLMYTDDLVRKGY